MGRVGGNVREDRQEVVRVNDEVVRVDDELVRVDGEMVRVDGEMVLEDVEMVRVYGEMVLEDTEMVRVDGEMVREDCEMVREDTEMVRVDGKMAREDCEMVGEDCAEVLVDDELAVKRVVAETFVIDASAPYFRSLTAVWSTPLSSDSGSVSELGGAGVLRGMDFAFGTMTLNCDVPLASARVSWFFLTFLPPTFLRSFLRCCLLVRSLIENGL